MHQPLGLIDPSTTLQDPLAVALEPGMKRLHLEHWLPLLGLV